MENNYDSTEETLKHIGRVGDLLNQCAGEFMDRRDNHDKSKLEEPEKAYFDKFTLLLSKSEYGSPEYKANTAQMKPALDHHYANNSHHPQYYENGIDGMNLFDILEMLCDWKASGERNSNGDIMKSIEINKTRFKMNDQLVNILKNTVPWLK